MPRDKSINSVLIIGSGPIIIGQACEFDYSGSQASRSLREEGIEVTLINSNPATIMTDSVTADNIFLLPLEKKSIEHILSIHKKDFFDKSKGAYAALGGPLYIKEYLGEAHYLVQLLSLPWAEWTYKEHLVEF